MPSYWHSQAALRFYALSKQAAERLRAEIAGAAVHGMRIRIGDKAVVARIKERQQAAKEFEEAKAAGKERVAAGTAAA